MQIMEAVLPYQRLLLFPIQLQFSWTAF